MMSLTKRAFKNIGVKVIEILSLNSGKVFLAILDQDGQQDEHKF